MVSTSHRTLARPTVVLAADSSVSWVWQNTEMQFLPFLSTFLHFLLIWLQISFLRSIFTPSLFVCLSLTGLHFSMALSEQRSSRLTQ
jgi:hypothetical protein